MTDRPKGSPPTPEEVRAVLAQVEDKLQLVLSDFVGQNISKDLIKQARSKIHETIQPIVDGLDVDIMPYIHVGPHKDDETVLHIEIRDPNKDH